jgi:hypothetical protein
MRVALLPLLIPLLFTVRVCCSDPPIFLGTSTSELLALLTPSGLLLGRLPLPFRHLLLFP